jgi:hypothetical protein
MSRTEPNRKQLWPQSGEQLESRQLAFMRCYYQVLAYCSREISMLYCGTWRKVEQDSFCASLVKLVTRSVPISARKTPECRLYARKSAVPINRSVDINEKIHYRKKGGLSKSRIGAKLFDVPIPMVIYRADHDA